MLYCAVPFTLLGASSRLAGVPISVKSFGSLRVTSAGTGTFAAASARSPYESFLPVAGWLTIPFAAWHDAGSTFQRCAAAAMSIMRAVAPALRSGWDRIFTQPHAAVLL